MLLLLWLGPAAVSTAVVWKAAFVGWLILETVEVTSVLA